MARARSGPSTSGPMERSAAGLSSSRDCRWRPLQHRMTSRSVQTEAYLPSARRQLFRAPERAIAITPHPDWLGTITAVRRFRSDPRSVFAEGSATCTRSRSTIWGGCGDRQRRGPAMDGPARRGAAPDQGRVGTMDSPSRARRAEIRPRRPSRSGPSATRQRRDRLDGAVGMGWGVLAGSEGALSLLSAGAAARRGPTSTRSTSSRRAPGAGSITSSRSSRLTSSWRACTAEADLRSPVPDPDLLTHLRQRRWASHSSRPAERVLSTLPGSTQARRAARCPHSRSRTRRPWASSPRSQASRVHGVAGPSTDIEGVGGARSSPRRSGAGRLDVHRVPVEVQIVARAVIRPAGWGDDVDVRVRIALRTGGQLGPRLATGQWSEATTRVERREQLVVESSGRLGGSRAHSVEQPKALGRRLRRRFAGSSRGCSLVELGDEDPLAGHALRAETWRSTVRSSGGHDLVGVSAPSSLSAITLEGNRAVDQSGVGVRCAAEVGEGDEGR